MSNKSDPNHELRDKDIAALFDRQKITVPESLDHIILEASRQVQADTSPSTTPWKKYPSWFAMAAVLVLAVAIGPLVLNAPTSKLQEDRTLISQEISIDASSAAQSAVVEPAFVEPATNISPSAAPAIIFSKRQGFEADSRSLLPSNAFSIFPSLQNDEEFEYRKLPEKWLIKIENLIAAKQWPKARIEYDLFRKTHPTYRKDFELPRQ